MKKFIAAALCAALAVSGCASSPDDVQAQYVSPLQYQSLTCDQIEGELRGISDRVATLTGQQRRRASQDKWTTGVGVVIFWPALFFLMRGDNRKDATQEKGKSSLAWAKTCTQTP